VPKTGKVPLNYGRNLLPERPLPRRNNNGSKKKLGGKGGRGGEEKKMRARRGGGGGNGFVLLVPRQRTITFSTGRQWRRGKREDQTNRKRKQASLEDQSVKIAPGRDHGKRTKQECAGGGDTSTELVSLATSPSNAPFPSGISWRNHGNGGGTST